jgi:cytosine/uracil/thiamine/allantoin permease
MRFSKPHKIDKFGLLYGIGLLLLIPIIAVYTLYEVSIIDEEKLNSPYMTYGEFLDEIIPILFMVFGIVVLMMSKWFIIDYYAMKRRKNYNQ